MTTETLRNVEKEIKVLSPEEIALVKKYIEKAEHKKMPAWKRKLYAVGVLGVGLWVFIHYLHYEACKQKYPQASGWVCLISPK